MAKKVTSKEQSNTNNLDEHYNTLMVGFAPKLSSKSTGKIGYEIALNTEDKNRYLGLTSNDSGGLFSREWVCLNTVFELIESQQEDKEFKSSIFKSVIKGGSANNVSFIAACLRCDEIGLILQAEKNQFLHVVYPLLINRKDMIMKLKPLRGAAKKAVEEAQETDLTSE
jgi:hypothetical protein